jgi:multicomponent Na+:H+ antiporter subunit E
MHDLSQANASAAIATTGKKASSGRVACSRGLIFLGVWLILIQSVNPADLAMGAFATAAATWASMCLLPPAAGSIRFFSLLVLLPYLFWESVRAGFDVALRALAPRPALNPGFIQCPISFPPGLARNTFATITSMLPGTVACGGSDDALDYHGLDTTQPLVEQLGKEERRLQRALIAGKSHE